jgi:hypothetical protein
MPTLVRDVRLRLDATAFDKFACIKYIEKSRLRITLQVQCAIPDLFLRVQ